MPKFPADQDNLCKQHYRHGNNLDASIQLHKRFSTNSRLFKGLA